MYSLRRTLAVRFCVTLLVALLLIAVWAFLGLHRTLEEQLDRSLESALELELDVVEAGVPLVPHAHTEDLEAFEQGVNRFVVLRDSDGRPTRINTPFAAGLPIDTTAFRAALRGERRWVTEAWEHGSVRAVYGPVRLGRVPGAAVLEVAASLRPTARANRQTLFVMAGTVLLSLVATAFGASWLASSAVAPVVEIAGQAEHIEPGRGGQRITAHADVAELHSLVSVLNRMLERLDRAFESQRRIIADVGHDLRTPLTSMRGEIEVALRGQRDAEGYRKVLRSVLEDVDQLGSIGESLILLARIEAGELTPHVEPTDLAELAAEAVRKAKARAGTRRVGLEVTGSGPPMVRADPAMVTVVLDHLLDNAVRHTPPGTEIHARIESGARYCTARVRDNGPGISADVLPHLFERLYRGNSARTREGSNGGAGLGLTVAAAILDAHGGTIRAANVTGGGFEISMALPTAAE